jgi:hypothetical protein
MHNCPGFVLAGYNEFTISVDNFVDNTWCSFTTTYHLAKHNSVPKKYAMTCSPVNEDMPASMIDPPLLPRVGLLSRRHSLISQRRVTMKRPAFAGHSVTHLCSLTSKQHSAGVTFHRTGRIRNRPGTGTIPRRTRSRSTSTCVPNAACYGRIFLSWLSHSLRFLSHLLIAYYISFSQ